ncbi:MAG: hypothetical protein FP810_03465 [Desulfocapsa sp.]|nr:hypothetical protein [Desulfocapsa sp.]MBU3944092.1 hypothetical protein [Pseudomonadota bacterium]MBU4107963.1 hypothetical protein [Pseudomonadota bacterium]
MPHLMPELIPQQQTMSDFDTLLQTSVNRYEDILALFEAINHDRGDNTPSTFDSSGTEILQMQEKAALADQELIAILKEMEPTFSAHLSSHPLMDRRQKLMQQILTHNRSFLSVINNIKSLLAHDIKAIQGGRTALNGYRQSTSSQNGGILNHVR